MGLQGGIARRARRRRAHNLRHRRTVPAARDGTCVVYWTSLPPLLVSSVPLGHGFCALVLWPPFVCARALVACVCVRGIFSVVRHAEFLLQGQYIIDAFYASLVHFFLLVACTSLCLAVMVTPSSTTQGRSEREQRPFALPLMPQQRLLLRCSVARQCVCGATLGVRRDAVDFRLAEELPTGLGGAAVRE